MLASKIILVIIEVLIFLFLSPLIIGVISIWTQAATSTGLSNSAVTVAVVVRPLYNPILADHAQLSFVQQKDLLQKISDCSIKCSDKTYLNGLKTEVNENMDKLLPTGRDYRLEINYPPLVEFGNNAIETNDTCEFTVVTPNFKYKNMMLWVG